MLGFALPSMIQLRNTPPLRVLRHDEMPPSPSRLLVGGLSLAAVAALLYRSVGDPRMLILLIGGIIAIAGLLYLVGRGLVALVGRARSGCGAAIVGDPDQVLAKLNAYRDLGIEAFILSGYPHKDECDLFGKYVLPQLNHGPLAI